MSMYMIVQASAWVSTHFPNSSAVLKARSEDSQWYDQHGQCSSIKPLTAQLGLALCGILGLWSKTEPLACIPTERARDLQSSHMVFADKKGIPCGSGNIAELHKKSDR